MRIKKIVAGILTATMVLSTGFMTAFASEATYADGAYTADVNMYKDGSDTLSMCAPLFGAKADITVAGESATVKIYVANPIPQFGEFETGTINQVTFAFDDNSYNSTVDVKAASSIYFGTTGAMFGIVAGESYQSDIISVTLPVEALEADKIDVNAFVAAVMSDYVDFDFVMANIQAVESNVVVDVQEVSITATVAENQTTYTVTVPESLGLGELSSTEDSTMNYTVDVKVEAGNDKKAIQIATAEAGVLTAGNDTIAFTNSFGTQKFTEDTTAKGVLTVKADAVANITSGEYAGVINFEISSIAQ